MRLRRIAAVEIDFTEKDAADFIGDPLNNDPGMVSRSRIVVAQHLALQGIIVKMETIGMHMNVNKSDWQIQREKEQEELRVLKEKNAILEALLAHYEKKDAERQKELARLQDLVRWKQ